MRYDFDCLVDRRDISVKYGTPGLLFPDCKLPENPIPMWIADMDFACCDRILQAIHKRVDRLTLGYENPVTPAYLEAVCGWMHRRHQWKITPEQIVTCGGAIAALKLAVMTFTKPGQKVLIQQPVYGPFGQTVTNCGRQVVNNPLIYKDGTYQMDLEDLEKKAADPDTVLLAFCNPHNPVGRVWTREELEEVCSICRRHGVLIVSDEVHSDIIRREKTFIPMGSVDPENVIASTSPGKTFNLTGMKLANIIIANQDLREKFLAARGGKDFPNPLAAAGAQAAYEGCDQWADQVNEYLDESFRILARRLPQVLPEAYLVPPESMFLAWFDLRRYGMTDQEISKRLVEEAGVVPDPGTHFGPDGKSFIRLNIACPHSVLNEALDRIEMAFAQP